MSKNRCKKPLLSAHLQQHGSAERERKAYNTWYSQAVSHPSTNQARPCLASEIGRDRACSGWYGSKPPVEPVKALLHCPWLTLSNKPMVFLLIAHTPPAHVCGLEEFFPSLVIEFLSRPDMFLQPVPLPRCSPWSNISFSAGFVFPHVLSAKLQKLTAPGIPRRSPIQVLTRPDPA